jgi:hypothetical protein
MNLFDLPTRDISDDSVNSTHSCDVIRKQNFDDRAQTRISLSLSQHSTPTRRQISSSHDFALLEWTLSSSLQSFINNNNFGSPTYVLPCALFLVVVTDADYTLGFNNEQELIFKFSCSSTITTVATSSDCTHLSIGFLTGRISLWNLTDLDHPHLVYLIEPVSLAQRFASNSVGHLSIPITKIHFIANTNHQLISTDISGLVFYHNIFKKFFNYYVTSQKLLGSNDSNTNNQDYTILGSDLLPLGTSRQITDHLGVLAIITRSTLAIVSILSLNDPTNTNIKTHYKVGRSPGTKDSASISWFPCMEIDGKIDNAKLSYSWNNVLTILEIDNRSFPENYPKTISELKDKDKGLSTLPIKKTCRWTTPEKSDKIISNKWLSSQIVAVFVQSHENMNIHLLFYRDEKLQLIAIDKLVPEIFPSTLTTSNSRDHNVVRAIETWENSIQVYKNRLVVLSGSKVCVGTPINWADRLAQLLTTQNYSQALAIANEYYNLDDSGKAALIYLPNTAEKRRQLLAPYLVRIMKQSIRPLLRNNSSEQELYLDKYLEIVSYLFGNSKLVPQLHTILEDIFNCCDAKWKFFSRLQNYILDGSITSLSPSIFKSLIETYFDSHKGELLTELICILDLKSLDIDLTVQLCKKYNLRDCLIYIWNGLLDDYSTPLLEFVMDIDNEEIHDDDLLRVYSYMSFVLTGKRYPTDRLIEITKLKHAKSSICDVLFSTTLVKNGNKNVGIKYSDTVFPYLYLFLKSNSFEMVSTLNEFFEDPYLNNGDDDYGSTIDRQYIVEALLDVFEAKRSSFTDYDRCQLAIFIARNYSKYPQFLRLSESVINQIMKDLYENTNVSIANDCELALQSLLPFYEPESEQFLIEKLQAANYYDVLINVYRSSGKYGEALEVWLRRDTYDDYETLLFVLENSFLMCKNPMENLKLTSVIRSNFSKLISIDMEHFIEIISKHSPTIHEEVLSINDDSLSHEYLEHLFATDVKKIDGFEHLLKRYIELSCHFNRGKVYSIVDQWIPTLTQISDLQSTFEVLEESKSIDSLSLLLVSLDRYEESLGTLLESMESLVDGESNNGKFNHLLEHAMKCCENSPMEKQDEEELYLNERLWLSLINGLVRMANKSGNKNIDKAIHDCFRRISDCKLNPAATQEQSFLAIFNKFLDGLTSGIQTATLSNIRGILQEVFVSYSYEWEMLEVSLRMLNGSIYTSMDTIRGHRLRGWILKSKMCASCNKPISGPDVIEDHFIAWENKQKDVLFVRTKDDDEDKYNHCQIIIFKCTHGYHSNCLQNLNGGDMRQPSCVICHNE